jgi:hypothetical protein
MTDQELARERAVRELARRLHAIAPDGLLTDIDAFAAQYWQDATERGHWRCMPPPPDITPVTPNPDAYERGAQLARQALTRKDAPHA